ncbi:unnamed protein product [Chondrus crispus]|uniref:Uncharacterized protein n=1 Tax=Chondrus crispus TaxID=2769 RepID=R7QI53_CHOCR|nr:unnamed protein product [Chondrus crispus]CDF37090.1 unnamed protein product [Chondrus crispus]|eukprot:XP_005716909.1 unnamed protein product [Chondrus crispus]
MCEYPWTCPSHPPDPERSSGGVEEGTDSVKMSNLADAACVCAFCGGAGRGSRGVGCSCDTPPDPDCCWSDTSSEGSLGGVVDIGYRDPSREYDFGKSSVDIMVGDLREIGHNDRIGGAEWGVFDEPSLLARTYRCGDLGFSEPITRERPAGRVGLFIRNGRVVLTVGKAEMVVSRMSELPTQNWYDTSTRSWPSWINRSREMYQTMYDAERRGLISLVSDVADMGGSAILIDVPLPWYGGKVYGGQKLVGLTEADIWQWTAEHRRGDYGPQVLIPKVMVPTRFELSQRKVFDTNPTKNNSCFMRGGSIKYERRWEVVELRKASEIVGMPVWVYASDLWDCSRKSIWLDRRSVDRSREAGLDYIIVGRDGVSSFVAEWADEDLSEHAELRVREETKGSGTFMPSIETVFRVWDVMWNKSESIQSLGDIAQILDASEEAVLMCGQEPRRLLPYAAGDGCYFRLSRPPCVSGGSESIGEVSVEVLKRSVISRDDAGYCITSLGKKRIEVGRKHIGPVRVGKGSLFDLARGVVGSQTGDMLGPSYMDVLPEADCAVSFVEPDPEPVGGGSKFGGWPGGGPACRPGQVKRRLGPAAGAVVRARLSGSRESYAYTRGCPHFLHKTPTS